MPISRRLGSLTVTALEDAAGPFFAPRREAFPTATAAQWTAVDAFDPEAVTTDGRWWLRFRAFTIVDGYGRTTIVDAGIGPVDPAVDAWTPVPGRLPAELAAADIDPGAVETVVLTHLHSDHTGWAVVPDGQSAGAADGAARPRHGAGARSDLVASPADGAAQPPPTGDTASTTTQALTNPAADGAAQPPPVVSASSTPIRTLNSPTVSRVAEPPVGDAESTPRSAAASGADGFAAASGRGRRPYFPNARYVIQRADAEALTPALGERLLAPLRESGQLHLVDGDHRLSHEITTVHTPGHTPGHQSVLLSHGTDELLLTGDVLVHAIQLLFPELPYAHEDDPGLARDTRERMLARIRRRDGLLGTSHLTEPFAAAGGS